MGLGDKLPDEVRDSSWIAQAFFQPKKSLSAQTLRARKNNSAKFKFYDTTLGGARVMNPFPQISRLADPKAPSISPSSHEMGEWYSEQYDDNLQQIALQFGIPEFNSIAGFISEFYDPDLGEIVNDGVGHGAIYSASKILTTLITLPLQAIYGVSWAYKKIAAALNDKPTGKYYYMNPDMANYWSAVSIMLTKIAVEMQILPHVTTDDLSSSPKEARYSGSNSNYTKAALDYYTEILPDVIKNDPDSGLYIDAYAVATRSQRLANQYHNRLAQIAETASSPKDYANQVKAMLNGKIDAKAPFASNLDEYLQKWMASPLASDKKTDKQNPQGNLDPSKVDTEKKPIRKLKRNEPSLYSHLEAVARDGSQFVNFGVEYTGPANYSFQNSTSATGLEETLNSFAEKTRAVANSTANFNFSDDPISQGVEWLIGAVGSAAKGVLSGLGAESLMGFFSKSFAELPEVWDQSTASIDSPTYKVRLFTPHGDKLSILMFIYAPLCMLMAGMLPRRTGKSAYGSPFLCRLHQRGRQDIKLGMIDNMQIEIGADNVGMTIDELPTCVDVTFSVKNLENLMSIPIAEGALGEALSFSAFDEDNTMTNFISALSGLGLYEQYYAVNRLKLAYAKTKASFTSMMSPAKKAVYFGDTAPGKLISAIAVTGDVP